MTLIWTRVDQKLIHGQISVGWVPHLSIEAIIVADAEIMDDAWAQKVMTMGLPPEIRATGFSCPARLADILSEDKYQGLRVMVIFRSIGGVAEAVASGFSTQIINLGNQACQCRESDTRLADTFYACRDDLEKLSVLQKNGLEVLLQALPTGKAISWKPETD